MFYPKQFKKGDTIEIVAPSNGISAKDITKLEKAISYLEEKGYKVIEGKNVRKSKNGVSSSKKENASFFIFLISEFSFVEFRTICDILKKIGK